MTTALIFPGQGSQSVGMGKALADAFPAARDVFQEVDEALGEHLSRLIWEGPEDKLTLTENAQPALMATSLAAFRVLQHETGLILRRHAALVAGHSLGEYSALTAAGTFSLADAARLLRLRGQAMQAAVPPGEGAMAAVLGLEADILQQVVRDAAQGQVCAVANYNASGQIVISGHKPAVERAMALAKERSAKRSLLLPVSAPFHCPLMAPAAKAMEEALAMVSMNAPAVPLIANVTAEPTADPETIRKLLVEQVTGSVQWERTIRCMKAQGVTRAVEIGAGKVLCGLINRTEPDIMTLNVGAPAEVESFAAVL